MWYCNRQNGRKHSFNSYSKVDMLFFVDFGFFSATGHGDKED